MSPYCTNHRTIKPYLPAIRHLHIYWRKWGLFLASCSSLSVHSEGCEKCEMEQAVPGKERLLVTSQILRAIKQVLEPDPDIVGSICSLLGDS